MNNYIFSSVQSLSCLILCDPMNCSTAGLPVHHQLPESTQTHVDRVGDAIQLSHPLSSPSPPALNLSQHQGLFQWVSSSHQVANYWSFSFNISPSNEHPGLISFRMDWLDVIFKKLFYIVASISYWLPIRSSVGKESTCNAGDPSLIPFLGRSAGEGTG